LREERGQVAGAKGLRDPQGAVEEVVAAADIARWAFLLFTCLIL
jgi:hypothetical protein